MRWLLCAVLGLMAAAALLAAASPGDPARSLRAARPTAPGAVRPAAASPRACSVIAAPRGSDRRGRGTPRRPYRTLKRLARALRPGQTGCLRAGTYGSLHNWADLRVSGRRGRRVTIRSYPGETATVVGYVVLEGSYLTLAHLRIDGSNRLYRHHPAGIACPAPVSQPLVIAGHDDTLQYDDYFQSVPSLRSTGIGIGFWSQADNTVIRYSKIHDVGQCQAYDHLVYLSHGNNVQIYDNWLYDDAHGRGVQLYPAPTNARVFDNVIDHVGEGFVIGDEGGAVPTGNRIYNNVVLDALGLPTEHIRGQAIHDIYGGAPGTGNLFFDNDVFADPAGIGDLTAVRRYGNFALAPGFIDAGAHDYRLSMTSRLLTHGRRWTSLRVGAAGGTVTRRTSVQPGRPVFKPARGGRFDRVCPGCSGLPSSSRSC